MTQKGQWWCWLAWVAYAMEHPDSKSLAPHVIAYIELRQLYYRLAALPLPLLPPWRNK
jgi:hypothetical protein